MKEFDVVLLTDSRYVNPKKIDPYIQNVLKEDRLVMDGLEKLNLRTIKKDWNDTNSFQSFLMAVSYTHLRAHET